MFMLQFGIVCTFLLHCCQSKKVEGPIMVYNRTSVALANETLHFYIDVTVPANSSKNKVSCFRNKKEIWMHEFINKSPEPKSVHLWAKINMHNSSDSGEYIFQYQGEKMHLVTLVRDVGYLQQDEVFDNEVIPFLVVTLILLLLNIMGSVYVFKWQKDHLQSQKGGDELKERKSERNVGVRSKNPNSDSVYTSLEPRPVSIYDVLSVDQARRVSTKKPTSEQLVETTQTEEGIFESVYENL